MFSKPNFTQVPNDFFDKVMPSLKPSELRVLIIIMRQTFGWGNKAWDRISISQLIEKTQMARQSVISASQSLVKKKLVLKHKCGSNGDEESWYSLIVENPVEFQKPIGDSNISYQSKFKTPPSLNFRPTKENTTKEIKESSLTGAKEKSASPPPPIAFSKKRKKVQEAKEIKADRVEVGPTQHANLVKKANGDETLVKTWYERLSEWKIKREIEGGNDYASILNWVIQAVKEDKAKQTNEAMQKTSSSPESKWYLEDLSDAQKENFLLNEELVEELKKEEANCWGLNFYYKHHVLKDKNNMNFSVSALINHGDFCRLIDKEYKLETYNVRYQDGKIR